MTGGILPGEIPDRSVVRLVRELSSASAQKPVVIQRIDELLSGDVSVSEGIKAAFQTNFRLYDNFLRKLHYKREQRFPREVRERILRFLTTGYLISSDVRYFNEFLWFNDYGDEEKFQRYFAANSVNFRNNLIDGGYHKFPLAGREEVADFAKSAGGGLEENGDQKNISRNARICLMGIPVAVKGLYKNLKKLGMEVQVVYIAHNRSCVKRLLISKKVLSSFLYALMGSTINYQIINEDYRSDRIYYDLKRENYDIGVQRQGNIIIKNNIIKSFALGILNNHIAVLPYVRGRSCVEYSVLFGFPIAATVHFIDEGIDTGDIINVYTYDLKGSRIKSIADIKNYLIRRGDQRMIDSINILLSKSRLPYKNIYDKGLQYYSIHKLLKSYINYHLIPKLQQS